MPFSQKKAKLLIDLQWPLTRGLKGTMQSGGMLREMGIAQGKFNELPAGTYFICYATRTSQGTAAVDFKQLELTIEVKEPTAELPVLETPLQVAYGSDIVVKWAADNGLRERSTPKGSWLGLYEKDSCTSFNVDRHRCFIAQRSLEQNVQNGTVRFSVAEYRTAGDYEVRYFSGDSRHGQGVVCRGMPQIQDTFLQCLLEDTITSDVVTVDNDDPISIGGEAMSSAPGLEAVFHHGEESYEPDGFEDEMHEMSNHDY